MTPYFALVGLLALITIGTWTLVGAVVLTLLFDGSTRFTEAITLGKYPEYAEYQQRTSRIVPMPPRAGDPATSPTA